MDQKQHREQNDQTAFVSWRNMYPNITVEEQQTTVVRLPYAEDPRLPPSKQTLIQTSQWRKSLAACPPEHMETGQLVFIQQEQVIAALPFQLIDAPFGELNGQVSQLALTLLSAAPYFATWKNNQKVVRILLIGDLLVSDTEHHQGISTTLLDHAVCWLEKQESQHGTVALKVLKEFSEQDRESVQNFSALGYHPVETEPEMILYLDNSWQKITDYTEAMKTKYRRRYKSARKKGKNIRVRTLDLTELQQDHQKLQCLLDNVMKNNVFCLAPEKTLLYVQMKKELQQDFIFRVYEIDGTPIGFSTAIRTNEELIAHRVGLDYAYNQTHKLYQNMLYDHIEVAISLRCKRINYGRTALEIKSAVGAEPKPLFFLIKHPSWMANQALRWILYATPRAKWIQRHPFRHRLPVTPQKPRPISPLPLLKWWNTTCRA